MEQPFKRSACYNVLMDYIFAVLLLCVAHTMQNREKVIGTAAIARTSDASHQTNNNIKDETHIFMWPLPWVFLWVFSRPPIEPNWKSKGSRAWLNCSKHKQCEHTFVCVCVWPTVEVLDAYTHTPTASSDYITFLYTERRHAYKFNRKHISLSFCF